MSTLFKHYKWDLSITGLVFALIAAFYGPIEMLPLAILVVLEISFSFDNAVVNAKVLQKMSHGWQIAFLTVGILIAVFGMRFVFPILIVSLTAGLGFAEVIDLALNDSHLYAEKLEAAHGQIAMLGGIFLLMIFLNFVFEEKEIMWLKPIEERLSRVGKIDTISAMLAIFVILIISSLANENGDKLMYAGVISLALYLGVNALANVFDDADDELDEESPDSVSGSQVVRVGAAGFGLFMYLEAQDAAFSFDGVSAAFAVTDKIVLIAAGLGVGALFVRSMTIHLLRSGHLTEYRYLEHGAHWAIGVLSLCILISIFTPISEYITGLIGVVFIAASVLSSIKAKKGDVSDELKQFAADVSG